MKTIVIRTLGGKGIGYGHYFRCLSLAKAIRVVDESINVIFLINEELVRLMKSNDFQFVISDEFNEDIEMTDRLGADLFIFDSYLGYDKYLDSIRQQTKLMLIDDNNNIYDSSIANIIYNGNIHADKLGYNYCEGQLRLLGPKYLIMKEEYWDNHADIELHKEGILITTGGTDEYGITLKMIGVLRDISMRIKVVIGPGYRDDYIRMIENMKGKDMELIYKPDSLKDYINASNIVITAGGSTIYEVLSQNSMSIIFSMADNQDLICKELSEIGIEYLGKYPNIEYRRLEEIIRKLENGNIILDDRISGLVKGNGALLVARILKTKMIEWV